MSNSPRLNLPYILPSQAQKHVSANESFRRLDALVHLAVKSATLAAEPASPAEGDAYILPVGATGASWSLMAEGAVAAYQDGAWIKHAPRAGWRAYVVATGGFRVFNGADWVADGAAGGEGGFATLGVNATPDTINRLAVKSDAALFSHDDVTPGTGDARLVINKSAAAKTASALLQSNFSGRAEIGLAGNDDLSVKVSADGAAWKSAMTVKADGKIGLNTAAPAAPLHLHIDGAATASSLISSDDFILSKESGASGLAGVIASPTAGHRIVFKGTKARGTLAAPTAAASGDNVCSLMGAVYDGVITRATAAIEMKVDGVVSSGVAPQRIEFHTGPTAALIERLRITSAGDVGIGVAAPTTRLDIDGPVKVKSYVKTALPPAAATGPGALVYVSNEAGGAVIAFSDGSAWRRVTDRAVVS